MRFFLMSQESLKPKIRFLGQKMCSVARLQTDTHTDRHESDYSWHPFRVSGVFPSTYHQGSAQQAQRRAAAETVARKPIEHFIHSINN